MAKDQDKKKGNIGSIQSDFITLTSHQLRTPLSGMKWLLELMQKSSVGNLNKKQKKLLFGSMKGKIKIAKDFDTLPEWFMKYFNIYAPLPF